jgi:hypothetical protein
VCLSDFSPASNRAEQRKAHHRISGRFGEESKELIHSLESACRERIHRFAGLLGVGVREWKDSLDGCEQRHLWERES